MIKEVYTFVAVPTGAKNEIVIGATAEQTAANIATALNATYGAVFTATSTILPSTDVCTGGTATAFKSVESYDPAAAFDDDLGNDWEGDGVPNWIKYDFGAGNEKTAIAYTVTNYDDDGFNITAWTFEGSNDNSNWTILDTQAPSVIVATKQTFTFSNTTAYRYYRWNISGAGANDPDVYELEIMEGVDCVSIIDHTSETITKTASGSGLSLSEPVQEITYTDSKASGAIPSFEVSAEGTTWGDLGDIYVMSILAPLTSSGSSIMSGNNGNGILPAFTASGATYLAGCNSASSDADIIALLRCGDSWMETFAAMVIVPGNPDDVAIQAVQFVHDNIAYVTDLVQYGVTDYWVEPRETLAHGKGDCEDGSFLVASLIRNSGVDYTRIRVYFGENYGEGHAWVMYRRTSDNQWVILDWINWDDSDHVDDLDAFYPILENQINLGEGESPANDNWAYGSAWAYVNCHQKVPLETMTYLSTMYSNPMLTEIIATMGAITSSGSSGGELKITIPSVTATIHGSLTGHADLTKEIARITISASAHSEQTGDLSAVISAVRVSSSGDMDNTGELNQPLPYINLSSSAINGLIGSLTRSIPSVKLTSSSYWIAGATIDISIPHLRLSSRAENSDILAILMNTSNFALTEYTEYDYNSLGFFNGKMVGAKSDGIYELTGTADCGENIAWSFKTGKLDMDDSQVKKVRHVWLSYNPSGDLLLTVADGEDEYEYDVQSVKQIDNAVRVKLGKGIRNRYLQFEVKNVANETIHLDRMRIFAEPIGKKR